MNKILNRIAWIVSIALGSMISSLFLQMTYEFWEIFDINYTVYWILIFPLAALLKRLFLSKSFIDTELETFAGAGTVPAEEEVIPPVADVEKQAAAMEAQKEYTAPAKDVSVEPAIQATPEPSLPPKQAVVSPAEAVPLESDKTAPKPAAKPVEAPKPKPPNFIQRFFAENVLAKVGGILLFLGVLFLLKLVYSAIGPVGKLLIGFGIGMVIYGFGLFLDKKKLITESRVLIGTAILINYLVILSGRFLIGSGTFTDDMILNEGLTFFLLILNTVFAVVTSLFYRSHPLLFFSFVFAYLNPFMVGAEASTTPYTLVGYGMIVSLGAVALSRFFKKEHDLFSKSLLSVAFIGGNILFLIAPFMVASGWLIKLIATGMLTLLTFFVAYKNERIKQIAWYFAGGYLFLIALIGLGGIAMPWELRSLPVLLGYFLFMILMLASGVVIFTLTSAISILILMATPLLIITGLVLTNTIMFNSIVFVLLGVLVIYLAVFVYISKLMIGALQYAYFFLVGVFVILLSGYMSLASYGEIWIGQSDIVFPLSSAIIIVITTFLYQISAYFFSRRKGLEYLYTMASVMGIILLATVIQRDGERMILSICSISGYMVLNLLMPFLNRTLIEAKVRNLVIGLVAGVLFASGSVFYFGEMYFSGLELGIAFLVEAVLYFLLGYALYIKLDVVSSKAAKDVVFTMLGISISLFSLAIAFVFSKHSEVVSAVWLFEASLMYFFYKRNEDIKVYAAGLILMAIGLWKLFELIDQVVSEEFLSLIPIAVIFGSLAVNLKFLEQEKKNLRWFHDIGHLIAVSLIAVLVIQIIPSHGHGMSILGGALGTLVLAIVYSKIYSGKIKHIFAAGWVLFMIYQIVSQTKININLAQDNLKYLIGIQYFSTTLVGIAVYLFNRFLRQGEQIEKEYTDILRNCINASFGIYLFLITSIYVYHIFDHNTFIITIYWGFLTFALLSYGIQKGVIRWRTLGLYILILTVSKILFFDVWLELENAVYRILALMLVGAFMIVISVLYQKKFDGNLKRELLLENLK